MQLSKPPKPKATRKRLKKEILSDDFKKRKIFWKNIAENFLENFPYGKMFYGKFSISHHYCSDGHGGHQQHHFITLTASSSRVRRMGRGKRLAIQHLELDFCSLV
jgi:hypothetical protein